ncbi:MAG: phenylalanine--tRNA ligase subunit beta [Steroidobacteraceae bacterium]
MKLPISWLRSWVAVPWSDSELAERLTMLGIEVESMSAAAPPFSGVVVAEIISAEAHPQADKLRVCKVSVGKGEPLQIVCGAPNARAGLRSALATVGALLPGEINIRATRLRGVESQGMLCSGKELQLSAEGAGILELAADAPLGASLRDYLQLDDLQIELGITPNRGDAMSVLGIARELAAISGLPMLAQPAPVPAAAPAVPAATGKAERFPVRLTAGAGAARFASCVVRGVDNRRPVPAWMRARLERSGLRSISPVVDVTNFIVLELGQPMHAYDLSKLHTGIEVRKAKPGEALRLLDGRDIALDADVLVIADGAGAVGMAGIMGGERSAISADTCDLFLEVAWFDPQAIAGRARRYGLLTDASQRYERGVDPALQERALQRATELICAIAGGSAGPACLEELPQELPRRPAIELRGAQISRLLGTPVAAAEVTQRLVALGMKVVTASAQSWRVTPPSWRFDIAIEADLIEELARFGGFDAIPEIAPRAARRMGQVSEGVVSERSVLQQMAARGYQEAINFGFTDPLRQQQLLGTSAAIELRNPIASNLSVMRSSLWPGLLNAALENQRRQRERVRLFEIATCFHRSSAGAIVETKKIAALALGARLPEQWGAARADEDFFDLKADVTALLSLGSGGAAFRFESEDSPVPCLHPGRSARIVHDGRVIGHVGELHPALVREFDFTYAPMIFELDYAAVVGAPAVHYHAISSFPQIRRDISFTVPVSETFGRIADRVSVAASTRLHELRVFDIYQGQGVESGRKSVALGLILQDLSRTLTDADADEVVARVCAELRSGLDARIRE